MDFLKYFVKMNMTSKEIKNTNLLDSYSSSINSFAQFKSLAVFVTTTDIEFECLYKLFNWRRLYMGETGYYYYETFIKKGDNNFRILMTRQNNMGMIASTRTATNIIWNFIPQYIIMTGVLAGIKHNNDNLVLGDVIIADKVWNCSSGKYIKTSNDTPQSNETEFMPRPQTIKIPNSVVSLLKKAVSDKNCLYPAHIGPITSSMSVVANTKIIQNRIISHSKNTIGLDMESYGIAYACHIESSLKPTPIIIKGICDFANSQKNYNYQRYAANNSSKLSKFILENYLPVYTPTIS